MFFKYLDFVSPHVTFYYKGFLSHASIFSGIISVISIIIIIGLSITYAIDLFKRKTPNSFFYNSFVKDAGEIVLNPSSLFHFVNFAQKIKGVEMNEGFDFTIFNIFGANIYIDTFLNNQRSIDRRSHWLYGYCERDNNNNELNDLLTYNFYEKSACVKKFYNATESKYYDLGDPKFVWPHISHGTFNELNEIYGLFIQKCNNKTIKTIFGDDYKCKSDSEIENFFNISYPRIINLYFINNFVNISDYEKPNNKFVYRIDHTFSKDQLIQSDLILNPVLIQSQDGLVFDNIQEDISYKYERNDVYIKNNYGINIYHGFAFFLTNTREYYVRIYKKLVDLISQIGGIFNAITIFSIYINSIYNNYIILSDTEESLHSAIHSETKIHKRKIRETQRKNKMKDIKNDENKKKSEKENQKESKENKTDIYDKDEKDITKSFNKFNNRIKEKDRITDFNCEKSNNNFIKDNYKINSHHSKEKNNHKNFWNFILYKITFKQIKKNPYKIYDDFRMKIISEEHLIRNHLNIYNLLKVTEKKRHRKEIKYHLSDLINLD